MQSRKTQADTSRHKQEHLDATRRWNPAKRRPPPHHHREMPLLAKSLSAKFQMPKLPSFQQRTKTPQQVS